MYINTGYGTNFPNSGTYLVVIIGINDSQNGGFFGTRIPNPREGEKNSFPRAKPEEKEFFYLPEGLEFLFQKNPPFWETDSNNYF